ncbi:Ppx/GppA phosphatase family protein [Capnocytophaga catalasegens]|uniref:Exopolyphosphatase n=1 Tax=Capnocytophaga catalasegens TaxID=1004260 RepID=A0AAV5AZ09_9FLAO|nr:exopolyphosphatase [Capnocytophaga catalasegens]GIZ14523.1 exopolyphosphatase [Capnocytophaga catalasegens]GJM50725.1 exopolyphosphatase [Capnocytophaga catalasegens]GJM51878.1 exopolyphosphatase [Capnocytophaga catalasegens]
MKIRKLAGIDIGSNGVRLLISNVLEEEGESPIFAKSSLVRVPIRLGADVFTDGEISAENQQRLCDAMQAYHLLMKINKVEQFRACATSAMREAKNGQTIVKKIAQKTGITIDIIDGAEEASIIATTDLHKVIKPNKNYIYIDVGGGSTEFTIYSNGKTIASKSFPIGTVRLLNDMVNAKTWKDVENWIKLYTDNLKEIEAVGSGGNINRIFKDSGRKKGNPLTLKYMKDYLKYVSSYSYDERVRELELNPDRADVITYATRIYINAMKWSRAKHILVPRVGLSDGIVRKIYTSLQKK